MRPEIDYTRQRTVAELLAEHGESGGPARRGRRRGDGPDRPVPPAGHAGPPRPHPGPQPGRDPGYRGGPPASARPAPPARRDRPTEMLADRPRPAERPGPAGYGGARGAAPTGTPTGTDRTTASGPVRTVGPAARETTGRGTASGPMRAVPPAGSAPTSTGARNGSATGGRAAVDGRAPAWPAPRPGARDAAPPTGRVGGAVPWSGPATATPWEPHRGAPPARPRPADRPAPAVREPGGRPYLPASPLPVTHRPATGPARGPERLPDSGPATGAYDPFEFDDDEDGPRTVVGGDVGRRDATRGRDDFPTLLDGPATALDLGRRPDGPPQSPVGRPRRPDGPATQVDVGARRGDGPATDFDVTSFDVTRRPAPRGAAALTDLSGPRPAGLDPAPGGAARGLAPRAGAAPAAPRVRPFVTIGDRPTQLTDSRLDELDQLDDRTDVAAPPRLPADRAPLRDAPDDLAVADPDALDDLDGLPDDRDELGFFADDPDHADLDDDGLLDDEHAEDDDEHVARPAHAWAGVVAQWLAGAVAGAVLWVLFRYLWRELPVVALAAAVLVTAGLVLLVRQLLHNVDRRTTGFAVLVGLLLTASPAVLVLLGR